MFCIWELCWILLSSLSNTNIRFIYTKALLYNKIIPTQYYCIHGTTWLYTIYVTRECSLRAGKSKNIYNFQDIPCLTYLIWKLSVWSERNGRSVFYLTLEQKNCYSHNYDYQKYHNTTNGGVLPFPPYIKQLCNKRKL